MGEFWDLYNKNREKTNLKHQRGDPISLGLYHVVVSIWIKSDDGNYLMSQRHPNKTYPECWECTGGSVLSGETSLQGALREVKEELGITLEESSGQLIHSKRREATQDFYDVWLFHSNATLSDLVLQKEEVINAKWMSKHEIKNLFNNGELHPLLNYFPWN
ncbi:NUDIX hydrolase [Clostridium lundense]|uniref:NUDIX hydrolase n=1 Tax=Clostridium lundense TaxID=319475 RepID=UPI0004819536|nr:NUDIX domain-containing protein [Clostridium lundense]